MSILCMNAVLDSSAPRTQLEALVLLVLAQHSDDRGANCWPSQPTIARKAKASTRGVRNVLQELEDRRLISVVAPATGTRSARYQLNLEAIQTGTGFLSRPEPGSSQGESARVPRPEPDDTLDRNATTPRPEPGSSDPSEPSLNRPSTPAAPVLSPSAEKGQDGDLPLQLANDLMRESIEKANYRRLRTDGEIIELFKQAAAAKGFSVHSGFAQARLNAAQAIARKKIQRVAS